MTAGGEAVLMVDGIGEVRVRNDLSEQEWATLRMGGTLNAVRARRAERSPVEDARPSLLTRLFGALFGRA